MCYTKGRFNTNVTAKSLSQVTVENTPEVASEFTKLLAGWDRLVPTATLILNEMKADIERLSGELKSDLLILSVEITKQNLSQRLNSNVLQQIRSDNRPYAEKIRWFVIRCEKGLEQELIDIYQNIDAYNNLLDDVNARGDFKTEKDLTKINDARIELKANMQTIVDQLSATYRKLIP
jgi:hypothetical protein